MRYDRWDVECQIDLGDGERAKVLERRQKEGGCAGDRHQQGRVISREAEILDQVPKVWNEPLKHTIHSFRDRIYFSRSTDLLLILLTPLQATDQNTFQYSRSGFRMNIDNLFGSRFHVLDALARTLPPAPYLPLSLQMIVFNTSHFLPPRITCIIRQFGAALLPPRFCSIPSPYFRTF